MRRIVLVLLLFILMSACAEPEPTSQPAPTATPWADREACLDLNRQVDDWIAGVGPANPDAFIAELRKIHSRLQTGSKARESLHEFLKLMNPGAAMPSDNVFERRFNRALTDCGLSPLPAQRSETRIKRTATPTATPLPTAFPIPTPRSTPASKWQACLDYSKGKITLIEVRQALDIPAHLTHTAKKKAVNEFCTNLSDLAPDIVGYIGPQRVSGLCGSEQRGAWALLRCAFYGAEEVYENRAGYMNEEPSLDVTFAPLACYIARLRPTLGCYLRDDTKVVPSGMRALHERYFKAQNRLLDALYGFESVFKQAYREIDPDLRERMFDRDLRIRLKDVEGAWNGYTLAHSRVLCQYTVCG